MKRACDQVSVVSTLDRPAVIVRGLECGHTITAKLVDGYTAQRDLGQEFDCEACDRFPINKAYQALKRCGWGR